MQTILLIEETEIAPELIQNPEAAPDPALQEIIRETRERTSGALRMKGPMPIHKLLIYSSGDPYNPFTVYHAPLAPPMEGGMARIEFGYRTFDSSCGAVKKLVRKTPKSNISWNDLDPSIAIEHEAMHLRRLLNSMLASNTMKNALPLIVAADDEQIFMEQVPGKDLGDLLNRTENPLSWEHKREILARTAEIAGFMHENGVVHRDICPKNIMVHIDQGKICQVTLIDLGIAECTSETESLSALNTQTISGKLNLLAVDLSFQISHNGSYGTHDYLTPLEESIRLKNVRHTGNDESPIGKMVMEHLFGISYGLKDSMFNAQEVSLELQLLRSNIRQQQMSAMLQDLLCLFVEPSNDLLRRDFSIRHGQEANMRLLSELLMELQAPTPV